jgi:hypothetical protein
LPFQKKGKKASSLFEGTHLAFAVGELLSVSFIPAFNGTGWKPRKKIV